MVKPYIIIIALCAVIAYLLLFKLPDSETEYKVLQSRVDSLVVVASEQAKEVEESKQETLEIAARLKLKEDFYPSIETKYVKIQTDLMRLNADSSIGVLADHIGRIPVSKYP